MTVAKKFTLNDLRAARASGRKVPMLTCYDYTMATLADRAHVPALLVGDSAANVILGHASTVSAPLDFMIEITAAVRRGAPNCLLVADMPFGSYHASTPQGMRNVTRMVQLSGCDCVKLETSAGQARLVQRLSDAGVAVMVHLGLKPQSVGLLGGYQARGRSAAEADAIVRLAEKLTGCGAAAILLEAVPPEVSQAVVAAVDVPVIGCGAGPACHGHVVVTYDAIGWTPHRAKFVPLLSDLSGPMVESFQKYMQLVTDGVYPQPNQTYEMPAAEKESFLKLRKTSQEKQS